MRILHEGYQREKWLPFSDPASPELWTTGDAARVLRVSAAAVRKFVRLGKLACHTRLRSGLRLFRADDVRQLAHTRVDAGLVTTRASRLKTSNGAARQQKLFGVQLRMVKALSPQRLRFTKVNRKSA
jgi:DNA-binding transcriptional MerR regulator